MRSDVPVSDTGTLKMEGRFQRASSLRNTPVNLTINFSKGQFGQITALVYGRDRGWRGGVTSSASLAGTPASLAVTIDARVDDFRRYDIALGEALRLTVIAQEPILRPMIRFATFSVSLRFALEL